MTQKFISKRDLPGRNDLCWCGSEKKYKKCHMQSDLRGETGPHLDGRPRVVKTPTVRKGKVGPEREVPADIPRPDYALGGRPKPIRRRSCLKSPEEIPAMRRSCAVTREVLDHILEHVQPCITTDDLDRIAHEKIIALGGYPSTLRYGAFPKSICTSINEVICHGIPDSRPLEDGDIMNVDVSVFIGGYHGDCSETVFVGRPSEESIALVQTTYEGMMAGIKAVVPGKPINVIGKAIQRSVEGKGFSVVRQFLGHGLGADFHMEPEVHHVYVHDHRTPIKKNMTFTIEPMVNAGHPGCRIWSDNWTAVTIDNERSAQFEHTVLVTDDGCEILTPYSDGPYFLKQLADLGIDPAEAVTK